VLASIAAGVTLTAILATALPGAQRTGRRTVSADNLRAMHAMHACYAADWAGRQFTAVPDDLSIYGNGAQQAVFNYQAVNGQPPPGLILGWGCVEGAGVEGCDEGLWGFWLSWPANASAVVPLDFDEGFGSFRVPNAWPLHDYLDGGDIRGQFFDERYFAPDDAPAYEVASAYFDAPCEYVPSQIAGQIVWSSYAMSPAAMFDPGVLRRPSAGGFQDPFSYADGLRSPAVDQAAYPDLKSWMIEHNWLGNPPAPCNPGVGAEGTSGDCVPYQFNHGADATPLTLFYDGSVGPLRTGDVVRQDARLRRQGGSIDGDGLWSRDTPWGARGYFGHLAADGTLASHHILTTDGIRGRDRIR
jgi:hypothetical protein